jgi:hypothetical protein
MYTIKQFFSGLAHLADPQNLFEQFVWVYVTYDYAGKVASR